jgi:hypothetical protein
MVIPHIVSAQEPPAVGLAGTVAAADLASSDLAPEVASPRTSDREIRPAALGGSRWNGRSSLISLSVTAAALQGLDAYTTLAATNQGAHEANPVMRGVVRHPAAFVAVKASMTAATIYAAHRLWPKNKTAAVAMLAVSNGLMAIVVARNVAVIRQQP